MRRHLNNPVIVIPLALLALFWGAYSYGLFDFLSSKFFKKSETALIQEFPPLNKDLQEGRSSAVMRMLTGDSWLTSNWNRDSMIKNEPFVTDFDVEKAILIEPTIPAVEDSPEAVVIVDRNTFESAIASSLGLDGEGFFVVFDNIINLPVRKRVGDEIYLKEGGRLMIPTLGIAEQLRTPEEQRASVLAVIEQMRLQAVATEASETFVEGEANTYVDDNHRNSAAIQIAGGSTQTFRQGDLVNKNPSLGLDQIFKGDTYDSVIFVDKYQNQYQLTTSSSVSKQE